MISNENISVSIIVPCYNCAKIVEETLESLQKQTYKNFETICINDGSTDNTLNILNDWVSKRTLNIKIVDKENGGVSRARNDGIALAKGRYILFLDADDIYHEEFVERMLEAVQQENGDTAYCRLTRNLEKVRELKIDGFVYLNQTQNQAMDKLHFEMDQYGFYCYIYRKDIIDKFGIRFTDGLKYFEDREFNWKYLCHCNKIAWIDEPLYGYRVTENSAIGKKTSWERCTSSLSAVKRVEQYLEDNKCEYVPILKTYLYHRVIWTTLKNTAISRDKELFRHLIREYDVRTSMKRTAKDSNKLVKLASILYLIHPNLFYYIVGLKK